MTPEQILNYQFQNIIILAYLKCMNCKDSNLTPPAPAATAGAIRTLDFLRTSTAPGVHGIFEPTYKRRTIITKRIGYHYSNI